MPSQHSGRGKPSADAAAAQQRALVLVLGMHRSGTSALTGVLEKLGVVLGEDLLPATQDNQKGYFENAEVVAIHEDLFRSLRRAWHDPRPMPLGWTEGASVAIAREALTQVVQSLFDGADVAAVKDPRGSLVAPLWLDVARACGATPRAILMVRHPDEVAASLQRRDGLSRTRAHLLWLRYMLEAERATRGTSRVFVAYDALLADWRSQMARAASALGAAAVPEASVATAEEIDRFLDTSLRNHHVSGALEETAFSQLTLSVYELARRCAGIVGKTPVAEFDAFGRQFETLAAGYLDAIDDALQVEGPELIEAELHAHRLSLSRIDAALQLAALRELWRPAALPRTPSEVKLYYRSDSQGFVESRAVTATADTSDGALVARFDVPAEAEADFIRLDPDEAPGVFAILSMEVDGQVVSDLARRITRVSEIELPTMLTRAARRFAALGDDPHFEVDLRGFPSQRTTDLRVALHFRPETVASELGAQLHDVGLGLRESHERIHEQQRILADSLKALQERLSGVGESLEHINRQAALTAQHDLGQAKIVAETRAEVGLLHQRTAQLGQALNALGSAFHKQASLAAAHDLGQAKIVAETRAEVELLHQRTAQLGQALNALGSAFHEQAALAANHDKTQADVVAAIHQLTRRLGQETETIGTRLEEAIADHDRERAKLFGLLQAEIRSEREVRRLDLTQMQSDLAHVVGSQSILLAWAKRRSPGYWLAQLSGKLNFRSGQTNSPRKWVAAPYANLMQATDAQGSAVWQATSDDPQFVLEGGQHPLEGGWYIFTARFSGVSGDISSPCLYPDYGDGFSEAERVFLPEPDNHGQIHAVARFKRRPITLRFDPSVKAVTLGLEDVSLVRVGRPRALLTMAAAVGRSGLGRKGAGQIVAAFLRAASGGQLRAGGDAAYRRYVELGSSTDNDYATWVRLYDSPTPVALDKMRVEAQSLAHSPLISIVMPVYQTPVKWLRRCIDSVVAQVYPNWELCIADDASPSPHVRQVLEEYARRDSRIRVCFRPVNGHISEASNSALELACGEYIALLDHDDELPPHALLEVAAAINKNPQWRLIYSDEDKIDEKGKRFDPYFKPDWNPELFLGQNCLSHLGVYETRLVRDVGGFRKGYEGSQDWDLALRCMEQLNREEIGHISKVLYHWRAISGSTALASGEKDYAGSAGLRAVRDHLARIGREQDVAERLPSGHIVLKRSLPDPAPKVSLIIPTRDKADLLRMSVGSILERTNYPDYEILIVDNQSKDPETLDYFRDIKRDPRVRVLSYNAPFNYSAINNFAAACAEGALLGLVNNDIEVKSPEWLREMASRAVGDDVGAVGAMLLYPNDTIQHAGVIVGVHGVGAHVYSGKPAGHPGQMGRAFLVQELSAITAACLIVRRSVFEQVGGLDEQLKVAFNDVDFCLRVRQAGYRNIWTPHAVLYHHESASRGLEDTPEKKKRFESEVRFMEERWGQLLQRDPSYNRNLSVTGEPFSLAFPPR